MACFTLTATFPPPRRGQARRASPRHEPPRRGRRTGRARL